MAVVNSLGMAMIEARPGTFLMGALNTRPDADGGTRHGLVGRRYATDQLHVPNGHFVLDSADARWGESYGDVWSAWCRGLLTSPISGQVHFCVHAHEGTRVWLDGRQVVDCWESDDGACCRFSARLEATKKYPLRIELRETEGEAVFRLEWEWDGHPTEPIPIDALEPMPSVRGWRDLTRLGATPLFPYGDHDERPVREVTVTYPFLMSESVVTADQYREFRPDYEGEGPAVNVSWHDAAAFCDWLSEKEGKPYRLPTEAEWEYACRAGTGTFFWSGDEPPPTDAPNPWGLKGLHANPPEWCCDWYGPYPASDETDPTGPDRGIAKVIRGGPIVDGHPEVGALVHDRVPAIDHFALYYYRAANRAAVAPTFPPPPATTTRRDRALVGELFSEPGFTGRGKPFVLPSLDVDFGPSSDYFGGLGDRWSFRVEGMMTAPAAADVLFRAKAHEALRLTVDDQTVMDRDPEGRAMFEKGRRYRVVVEMTKTSGEGELLLTWQWDGQAETTVPMDVFDEADIPSLRYASPIGFRVVQAPLPDTARPYEPPFAFQCVKQSDADITHGPDPSRPWFKERPLLPIPPENVPDWVIEAAGLTGFGNHLHSPAACVCPNGDLLYIPFCCPYPHAEYYPHFRFAVSRLRFGAEQWDMPEVIWNQASMTGESPLLWNDDGTIRLFFGGVGLHRVPFRSSHSTDNGATWSPTQTARLKGVVGSYSPQPISTAFRDGDGTMYVPCDGGQSREATWSNSLLWASDDEGETWYDTRGRTHARHSPVVVLKDGSFLSLGGKNTDIDGYMPFSISHDRGRTWESFKSPFPRTSTRQRPAALRLASGRIFFASDAQRNVDGWQPEDFPFRGAFVALSDDEGQTWHIKRLDAAPHCQYHDVPEWLRELDHSNWHHDGTIGYAVAAQSPNGLIHLLLSSTQPNRHFEFNEAWILADAQEVELPKPRPGEVVAHEEHYPNGQLKCHWSSTVASDGRYLLHGAETHFFEDGRKHYEVTYDLGRKVGEEVLWSLNGEKQWAWRHEADGLSHWAQWWDNGLKKHESTWLDHCCQGVAQCWDPSGRMVTDVTFINGYPEPGQ